MIAHLLTATWLTALEVGVLRFYVRLPRRTERDNA
jgi:hypothetical protein